MWDNIDNMQIDFQDEILAESQRIQAIRDITKKLQQLRKDFYEDENKLETVKQATRNARDKIKEKVKEKAGKIMNNKNLEKSKLRFQKKKLELLN